MLVAPQADVAQDRHDAHEEEPAERPLELAGVDVRRHLGRQAERVPHLLAEEAVAHPVAGVDAELLALVALVLGELRVVVAKREAAEHHVAGLVLHHVRVDRLGHRVGRLVADEREGGEREPFDEHLHAEVGHVPAAVADDVVEQRPQVRVQRVDELQLLVQVAAVDLDVAGLVDDLGGGVELRVDVRHRLDDLGGADERALLAVHELAELPRREVPAHLAPLVVGHLVPPRRAVDGDDLVGHAERVVRVDIAATSRLGPSRSTAAGCPCRRAAAVGRARRCSRSRRPSSPMCRPPTRARRCRWP